MIYLDYAATTPILPEVVDKMTQVIKDGYGNPSSIHSYGRKSKVLIEQSRKKIAKLLKVQSSEIIFTSGATEANNFVLINAVKSLGVRHIVTSRIEHSSVLDAVVSLQEEYGVTVTYVDLEPDGGVSLDSLEKILSATTKATLLSLMLVNNEVGNILPIDRVSDLCKRYNVFFHSDIVQAVGKIPLSLSELSVDFISASGHKFYAPKGVGFVYVKKGISLKPILLGGGQERGLRSGTENIFGIVTMAHALEIILANLDFNIKYIASLKANFIQALQSKFEVRFNGASSNLEKSIPHILNVTFKDFDKMLLFNLDLRGVAVSGGSACQSGAGKGSHVLNNILTQQNQNSPSVRFSFSHLTTEEELKDVFSILMSL